MKRKLLIALLVIAVVVGTVSIITSVGQSKARNALADYKAKLHAQGEKLTFAEMGYPFPLETNANLENFVRLANLLSGKSQLPGSLDYFPYESPGQAKAFCRGSEFSLAGSQSTNASNPGWNELSADMKASAGLLAELRTELEHPPRRFGWDYTNLFAAGAPRNPFVEKRRAAQFLAADCVVALHESQLARAQSNLHALTQLTQVHRDDWTLVSAMIRVAIAKLGLAVTWQALQADGWDDASLAYLQHDWEAVDLVEALATGFEGERRFGQQAFTQIRTNKADEASLIGLLGGRATGSSGFAGLKERLFSKAVQTYWRSHMDEDEMLYLRDSQTRLETIRKLKTNPSASVLKIEIKAQYDELDKVMGAPLGKYRYLFSATAIPNFTRAFETAVQSETQRRMTIIAIALKRFHLRHGGYPAALAELAPQFLAAELVDPWSGKPFHYYLNADGTFTLYSVGLDGRDNGGDPTPEKSAKNPNDLWSGKDAVWPKPVFPNTK